MPGKATSKRQFRLLKAVETGTAKLPGLSPREAGEMTAGQSQIGLPERSRPVKTKNRKGYKFN